MKKSGLLTLIPTPIDEQSALDPTAKEKLLHAWAHEREQSIFVVEEAKVGRRRWLQWGLPRETIDSFVLYNEHNAAVVSRELLAKIKSGHHVYLMTDGGLPAFCDPGQELVNACHDESLNVTSTPFCNSVALAWALSGFKGPFFFHGFIPAKKEDKEITLKQLAAMSWAVIIMDTPYHLTTFLESLKIAFGQRRKIFLAIDLNTPEETLFRGFASEALTKFQGRKAEFVAILSPLK